MAIASCTHLAIPNTIPFCSIISLMSLRAPNISHSIFSSFICSSTFCLWLPSPTIVSLASGFIFLYSANHLKPFITPFFLSFSNLEINKTLFVFIGLLLLNSWKSIQLGITLYLSSSNLNLFIFSFFDVSWIVMIFDANL